MGNYSLLPPPLLTSYAGRFPFYLKMFSRIVRSLVRQFHSSFPEEDYIPLAPLILYLALLFLFFLNRLYA